MRKVTRLLMVAIVVIMASGCILTLNSIFTAQDVTYDPALEGVWQVPEESWSIKPFDKPTGRYVIQTMRKDRPPGWPHAEFHATLGTVGTIRFLELTPKRPPVIATKSFFGGHFIALHSFWKVSLQDDKLTLTSMSSEWLESMIKKKKTDLRYEMTPDGLLFLTDSTQRLRDFIGKYADDLAAFPTSGDEKGTVFMRDREKQ